MSRRMLPAWVIFPVVLPTRPLFSSAFWINKLSISSKFTSTEMSLLSFLMGTSFLPNGRTMKTFVMMHLQHLPGDRLTCAKGAASRFPAVAGGIIFDRPAGMPSGTLARLLFACCRLRHLDPQPRNPERPDR